MWLELADGEKEYVNPYILVPGKGGRPMYVREDHFDHLPNSDFNRMMRNLAPFQKDVQQGMLSESEFLADRKARKEKRAEKKAKKTARKDEKKATKAEKKKTKVEKKKAKVDLKKAKAEKKRASGSAKQTRADAKLRKAEGKAQGRESDEDSEENESRGAQFFGKVKGVAGKLLNKYTGGAGGGDEEPDEASGGGSTPRTKKSSSDDSDETPFYKKPLVIGTGIVLLAGGIYLATRPRRRAA